MVACTPVAENRLPLPCLLEALRAGNDMRCARPSLAGRGGFGSVMRVGRRRNSPPEDCPVRFEERRGDAAAQPLMGLDTTS